MDNMRFYVSIGNVRVTEEDESTNIYLRVCGGLVYIISPIPFH